MHRFYCPDLDTLVLGPEESHHAVSVLRLGAGDALTAFDGRGREVRGKIESASRDAVRFSVLTRHTTPAPAARIRLGQAVPKGKAMDLILQKTTELGVAAIHPVLSDRSVVQLDGDRAEDKAAKWRQAAIEACKQCGQNHLPEVHAPLRLSEFATAQRAWRGLKLVASLQPEARPLHEVVAAARAAGPCTEATIMIGPEGDFTPAEYGLLRSEGYQPVSLGPAILRTETAALLTVGILLYEFHR